MNFTINSCGMQESNHASHKASRSYGRNVFTSFTNTAFVSLTGFNIEIYVLIVNHCDTYLFFQLPLFNLPQGSLTKLQTILTDCIVILVIPFLEVIDGIITTFGTFPTFYQLVIDIGTIGDHALGFGITVWSSH